MFRFNLLRFVSKQCILRSHLHSKTDAVPIHRQSVFKDESVPIITMPHTMVRTLDKLNYKKKLKEAQKTFVGKQVNLIINCKNKKLNHYKGQTYSNFNERHFASGNWKGKKSKNDYFTIVPSMKHPALQDEVASFSELGLSDQIVEVLNELGFTKPTAIQSKVIPSMLKGNSVHCAAETGNGKTLAFLIPAINNILKVKEVDQDQIFANRPISVIVVPAKELADQIYAVAKEFGKRLNFKVDVKCGGRRTQKIIREFKIKPVDLLVATPGILCKLLSNKYYKMDALSFLSLDEVDTLFDDSFADIMTRIIRKLKILEEKPILLVKKDENAEESYEDAEESFEDEDAEESFEDEDAEESFDDDDNGPPEEASDIGSDFQIILSGATMPKGVRSLLSEMLDMNSLDLVTTPHLNCILPHVKQKFIRLQPDQKLEYLTEQLKVNTENGEPTIIFCNRPETVDYLDNVLKEKGVQFISFHGKMPQKVRWGRFLEYQKGLTNVMISTDIGSRGLDTIRTKHIINYDFPLFMSDYIHRSGRVGRVGSPPSCKVTNYVVRKWDVDLVWKIETSLRRNEILNNVNANIKRKLDGRHSNIIMEEQHRLLELEKNSSE